MHTSVLKIHIFLSTFLYPAIILGQQMEFSISGQVYDIETSEPLPCAEIYIHELVKGTVTDIDGSFSIEGLLPAQYHLHVHYIGYHSYYKLIILTDNISDLGIPMKSSYLELMEVVVESDPLNTGPVEKSQAIQTVTSQFLQRNPGGTLMNSLQKLPGINAINTGMGISKPVIRGMSFNRVLVMDRGIKQEGQQWCADHGLEIDQFDPEQVEIVMGPSSLQYGSDGIGGVLVINPPYFAKDNMVSGSFLGIYKSNNDLYGTSTMLKGNKENKIFQLRLSTQDYGDFKVPASEFNYNGYILPIYNNLLKNTGGRERNISGMAGIKGKRGFSTITVSNYHLTAGMFPGATGIPREYDLLDDGNSRNIELPRQVINHFKIISNSNILFNKNWLDIDLGFQYNDRNEEGDPHSHGYQPTPEGNLALGLDLFTYSGNIKYMHMLSSSSKRTYGLQVQMQKNSFSGYEFLLPAFYSATSGFYLQQEKNIQETLTLNGGLRVDYGIVDIKEHVEPDFSTVDPADSVIRNPSIHRSYLNLSGAIGFSYYPTHYTNLKLNLGSSYRIPTASELASNGVHHGTFRHEKGDSSLESERGWQLDVNYTFHRRNFYINLSPFLSYFHRFIYLKPMAEFSDLPGGGQVFQYTQNNVIFWGGEANLDYHILEDLHLSGTFEYVWNLNIDSKLPLPFTPPLSILTECEYKFPLKKTIFKNNFVNINARFTMNQKRVDRNENPTDGYVLVGFSTGSNLQFGKQTCELVLTVQNLLDTFYMNHMSRYRWLNLPEQGRNINISLRLPF